MEKYGLAERAAGIAEAFRKAGAAQAERRRACRALVEALPDGTKVAGWTKVTLCGTDVFFVKGKKGVASSCALEEIGTPLRKLFESLGKEVS